MMTRASCVALVLSLLLMEVPGHAQSAIRVTPLPRDGELLVTFELSGGVSDEMLAAIHSGLAITFSYDVDLRRGVPFWIDRTIATAHVAASVHYDNLTRRHQLIRTLDGRSVPDETVTEDETLVKRWLTDFERLPLFSTDLLEPNSEYYVRIRARTQPHSTWALWPWGGGTWGLAKFTFLP